MGLVQEVWEEQLCYCMGRVREEFDALGQEEDWFWVRGYLCG